MNKAAQQAMFKLRQLHVEEQGDPNVINIEENDADQSHHEVSQNHDTRGNIKYYT